MTDLALDTKLTAEQREYVDTIVQVRPRRCSRSINDILDFSKIEARKLELEQLPFALRDTVEDAMKTLGDPGAAARAWSWPATSARDVPDALIGDPGPAAGRSSRTWSATPSSSPSRAKWW